MNDVDLIELMAIHESRENFWAYYQYNNPGLKIGWWQRELCYSFQDFYTEWLGEESPEHVKCAPPQHGKSEIGVWFISWISGKHKYLKSVYVSYSDRLGKRANEKLQKIYTSDKFKKIFGPMINEIGVKSSKARNLTFLDYIDSEGSFRNTTCPTGAITGEGLDLAIIDDPLKGREQSGSPIWRQKVWEWFTTDFYTRFSENAGFITILTRWNSDDPVGRMLEVDGDDIKVFSYPAIAEEDEEFRKAGEALFPQHKSLSFLLKRKKRMSNEDWQALYQQNPLITGGGVIKVRCFEYYKKLPIIKFRKIFVDTAQKTSERNDYSVFQCWGFGQDNKAYLIDQIRGKWEAPELQRRAVSFWKKHIEFERTYYGALRAMYVEDKSSGTGLIQQIKTKALFPIIGIPRTTDKYTRVLDILPHIESGYVMLPEDAPFTNDFVCECEAFTSDDSHKFDDQVDCLTDACNDMLGSNSINVWERLGG